MRAAVTSVAGQIRAGRRDAPEYEHFDDGPSRLGEDVEGARLVALNMALNGTPREETDRYLAENFELDDREQLLDEVYSSVAD